MDYSDYKRAKDRARVNQALSRIAVHAAQIRERQSAQAEEVVHLPKREVEDSYVYTRGFLGLWKKRPTTNTRVRRLMGEK